MFDKKHLKKDCGHIGRKVVNITIKMKTIVRKTLNDKNQVPIKHVNSIILILVLFNLIIVAFYQHEIRN